MRYSFIWFNAFSAARKFKMKIIIYCVLALHLFDDKRMVKYDIIPDLIIVSSDLIV
jgi:hypothetical protein